jgi:hypothetical protein
MSTNQATLKILSRANPACSICGTEFGSEGLVRGLIDAFALHVRRRHLHAIAGHATASEPASRAFARVGRKAIARR